jgi:hypothetical protein
LRDAHRAFNKFYNKSVFNLQCEFNGNTESVLQFAYWGRMLGRLKQEWESGRIIQDFLGGTMRKGILAKTKSANLWNYERTD